LSSRSILISVAVPRRNGVCEELACDRHQLIMCRMISTGRLIDVGEGVRGFLRRPDLFGGLIG
jgi:hypothetical protein